MSEDTYQKRYSEHQKRKARVLIEIMKERHSDRRFTEDEVEDGKIQELIKTLDLCPSSCDRKAVSTKIIKDRDHKTLLGGVLVGGAGWIHRAPAVILITADGRAYKAGQEIDFMPFLDGGVVVQQLGLSATAMGLSGTFVNPSIRDFNQDHFRKVFLDNNKNLILLGAYAIGYPHKENGKK